MNKESPLVPQGSFLEQKNQGRNRVKIAVFVVLAIHGAGLMALLMQGCQKAPDNTPTTELVDTNAPVAPTFVETTPTYAAPLPDTNAPIAAYATPTTPVTAQTSSPPVVPEPLPLDTTPQVVTTPTTSLTPPASASSHKIVAGDTLGKLARDYKVSVRAIEAANPGIEPTRLQVNQVIQIPAPAPQSPSLAVTPATSEAGSNGGETYKVKSGDTLIRIASQHGVSVKALRAANGLRTDRIRVNQVLKIPARSGGAAVPNGSGSAMTGVTSTPLTGSGNP